MDNGNIIVLLKTTTEIDPILGKYLSCEPINLRINVIFTFYTKRHE